MKDGQTAPSPCGSRILLEFQLAAAAPFSLAVADHAARRGRIVEGGTERVCQRVPQLTALVDRARRVRSGMAGDATGEAELTEQLPQAGLIAADVWVDLRVRAFEIGLGDDAGPPWPGP